MNKFQALLIVPVLFLQWGCSNYKYTPAISESDLHHQIDYLASDRLQGRYPGSPGDQQAGDFIEKRWNALQLQSRQQEFNFLQSLRRGPGNTFEFNGKEQAAGLYTPFPFSKDTLVKAPVVFAGYGITVKTDSFAWDDYAGLDVKGKWVMVLRGKPEIPGITDLLSLAADDRDKAMLAGDNHAAGIMLVSGYQFDPEDNLVTISAKQSPVGIPVVQISRTLADLILGSGNHDIATMESMIRAERKFPSLLPGAEVTCRTEIEKVRGITRNHFAILEGSDPLLKNEYVIVGAHFDHLGTGGPGSSSRRPDTIAIHNGADDNASGVTALLELSGKLVQNRSVLKRSVILVAFGAEEMGLLGSKYFVNHMPVDVSNVVAMVNLDMVGRLDTARGVQVGGTGTSLEADSLIDIANNGIALKLTKSREGSGPSDHSSFYGKNIPVFFITTGAHTDYHTPGDDTERINIQGLKLISEFAENLVTAVASSPARLTFQEAGPRESASPGYRFKVTLGFMPDFSATDVTGVRVDFVSKGKAAERGGIKNGDIITAIDGLAISNIYDYMYRLAKLSKNQIISVEVMRNGKKEVFVIQL